MSKTKMQTILVIVPIVTLVVAIVVTFTFLLFQGFKFRGFNISSDVQLLLVKSGLGELAGLLFLAYRSWFSEKYGKRQDKKPRREIDRIYKTWLELINLEVYPSVKLRKRLEQCKNNFPKVERRKTYRRKEDYEIYTYALTSP